MLKVAVLVSGGGTNLQAILDAVEAGTITHAQICAVISNNPGAYALERARKKGVEAVCISPKDYETREAFHEALLKKLQSVGDAGAGLPEPDHQRAPLSDPLLLRNGILRAEGA